MKKFITLAVVLSMLITAMPVTVGASTTDGTTYAQGDLVWSQDFEGLAADTDFMTNLTNGITFPLNESSAGSATIKEDAATGNKYLHMSSNVADGASSQTRLRILVPAGDAIDTSGVFTFDVDMKIDAYDSTTMAGEDSSGTKKYTEYDMGLASIDDSGKVTGISYMTLSPNTNEAYTGSTSGLAINGTRKMTSVAKQAIPGDTALALDKANIVPHAWNTYRFISRYDASTSSWYADTYLNGMHFYAIGQRNSTNQHDAFVFTISLNNSVKAGAASIDNIKAYYGAAPVSADAAVTKGKFNIDTFDFNDAFNDATTGHLTTGTTNKEIFYGKNYDHTAGVLQRYNTHSLTVDSTSGKAGKKTADKAISVTTAGKFVIQRHNTTTGISDTQNSTKLSTYVPEGDSLEFATEVLFKDINDALLFYLARSDGSRYGAAIEITPALWSTGTFGDYGNTSDDTITNNRARIDTMLPLNKWIKVRMVLTRGTGTGSNKLSIYADNITICENVEPNWNRVVNSSTYTYTADQFSKGIAGIHIIGTVDIDNFEINKYLCGESFVPNTAKPLITANKNASKDMSRGRIYANGKTVNDILTEFKLVGDELDAAVESFVVRDANGADVTDYTDSAAGKYIELLTVEGEHLYVTLVANTDKLSITESADGTLSGFSEINVVTATDDEGNTTTTDSAVEEGSEMITVTSSAKGYGRATTDTSMVLTNSSETNKRRLVYSLNSYGDVIYEFSFLGDANTDFSVGYDVGYVMADNTTKDKKLGTARSYKEMLTIADNKVTGVGNSSVDCGTYRNNEWTKVKIYLNRLNTEASAFSAYVSVNDGEYKWVTCGPNAYPLIFKNLYINLPAQNTVVLDDIKITEGITALSTMPSIGDYSGIDGTALSGSKLTMPAYSELRKYEIDSVIEKLTTNPSGMTILEVKSDGVEATDNNDVIERLVVNDGRLYRYYSINAAYFAEELDDDDDTRYITFRLYNTNQSVLEKSAIIVGVYDEESGKMKKLKYVPVYTNSESEIVSDAPDNKSKILNFDYVPSDLEYNSGTDEIRYFLWNMETLNPLGASIKSNR